MRYFVPFVLLNIFCVSFSIAQKKIPLIVNMNLEEHKISDYASSIKYVALETKDECLLSDELQVITTAQYVFVHDYREYKVYRFDITSGKYLNTVGKRGQGPGEYARLQGFYIDDLEKKCFLLSNTGIYVYSYNGKFLNTISIPPSYSPFRMERIGDYYVLNNALYLDTKKELCLLDLQGKLIKEKSLSDKSSKGFILSIPLFYKQEDLCYYKNDLTETIYLLDEKLNMKPVYWIDCGKKVANPKENQYDLNSGKDLSKEKIKFGQINGYNNHLYIPYFIGNKRFIAVYNIKNGTVATVGQKGESGFTDDITNGPMVLPPTNSSLYHSCIPGQLISWFYPSDIDADQYLKGEFGKMIKEVGEDSNPIIHIINLK